MAFSQQELQQIAAARGQFLVMVFVGERYSGLTLDKQICELDDLAGCLGTDNWEAYQAGKLIAYDECGELIPVTVPIDWSTIGTVHFRKKKRMGKKQAIRAAFRSAVFKRDKLHCRCCGKAGYDRQELTDKPDQVPLDAHHITDRTQISNGGYVKENGISVCDDCHLKAEAFWNTGKSEVGFSPDDLYKIIGSSKEIAEAAALK